MQQYILVGRVCDGENYCKMVRAYCMAAAEEIFKQYLRDTEGYEGDEFYIEHCQPIGNMKNTSISYPKEEAALIEKHKKVFIKNLYDCRSRGEALEHYYDFSHATHPYNFTEADAEQDGLEWNREMVRG